ncbi:hypothetical protein Cni_G14137 [Canna indica]|uniref:C2H2-type domain-containing protein n=1 Tax=Canna indica TaxID=4628 RepID=A0AAQ3KB56_9LILI|nr:hypothetical protein Cni_G14137 [Canna indica]
MDHQFAPSPVIRGKRTKRPRPAASAAPASSISSAEFSSTTTTTEEDQDMANCLILLARGPALEASPTSEEETSPTTEKSAARQPADEKAPRFDLYQCKTCGRCFQSFQALGGHRTSHRKPKTEAPLLDEERKSVEAAADTASVSKLVPASSDDVDVGVAATAGSSRPRVHECSICGSKFSSGQALGGHMRRHRPMAAAATEPATLPEVKKEKHVLLSLDLNLPAQPEDDDWEEPLPKSPSAPAAAAAFSFENQRRPQLVFSASSLVGCHY